MDFLRVRFSSLGGFAVDALPAVPELNPLFRASAMAWVRPLSLASQLGRVSEGVALRALARAYAEGVIAGSPTPEASGWGPGEWVAWLLAHPGEFDALRAIVGRRKTWEDLVPGVALEVGPAPAEGSG